MPNIPKPRRVITIALAHCWHLNDDTVLGVNRVSQLTYLVIGVVAGTNSTLQSLEPSFHQDLNGDDLIGVSPPASSAFQMVILLALNAPTVLPTATVIVPTSGDTVTVSDLFSHAADDAHGNAVITVAADQSIKVQDISTQILQQHLSDFHLF
jgi:hypothetical protein